MLALPPNCSERNRVLQRVNTFALSKLGRLGPEASSSRRSRRLLLVQRKNRATGAGGEREGARGGGMAAMAGSRTSSARRGPVRRARDGKGVGSFDPPPSLYPHRASNDTHSIWCDRINSLRCSSSRKKRMPLCTPLRIASYTLDLVRSHRSLSLHKKKMPLLRFTSNDTTFNCVSLVRKIKRKEGRRAKGKWFHRWRIVEMLLRNNCYPMFAS